MNKFTKAIELHKNWSLIKISWTKKWKIKSPFIWFINYEKQDWYIEIEKWFETDMGSIPRFLWLFFNPTKYISFILHDKCYKSPFIKKNDWISYMSKMITRKECDLILLEALKAEWANIIERYCIYIWVRLFGSLFYKKDIA